MRYILIISILFLCNTLYSKHLDSCAIFKADKYYNCNDTSLFSGWVYTKFDKSSKIKHKFYVKMGQPDSVFYEYNKKGKLVLMDFYNKKLRINEKIEYYKNRKMKKSEMYFNDTLMIKREYFNGRLHSLKQITCYDTTGKIDSLYQFYKFKNKKEQRGQQKIFSAFSYEEGKLNAISYFYYRNGMVREKLFYNSGEWLKTEFYNQKGIFNGVLTPRL